MARARNIKPGFFANDLLAECEPLARLLFAGLWTVADREGRLEDRPKKIGANVLPYDVCDTNALLDQLAAKGFIVRYVVAGIGYIQITTWAKHQNPHQKEAASDIPAPDHESPEQAPDLSSAETKQEQGKTVEITERAGLNPESLSLIPESISVPKGTGGEPPPTDRDLVFAKGVPLLTTAAVSEKNARSMLAMLCKQHGEGSVLKAIEQTAHDRPGEPVAWLQSLLKARPANGSETPYQKSQRQRVAEFAPGIAKGMTIDEVPHVIAIASR